MEKKNREKGNQNIYEELIEDIKQKSQGRSAVNRNWIIEKIYWKTGKKQWDRQKCKKTKNKKTINCQSHNEVEISQRS